jgi:hypothetical protein
MCGSSGACIHGECVAQQTASSAVPACICNALYAGAQCSFRNGNLYFEVPLACTFLLVLVVLGLRVTEKATAMLRLPEHHRAKYNLFAFPRQFVVSERISGVLASCVGTWVGDTSTKGFPILAGGGRKRKQCVVLENIFIVVAVLLELVMWFQIAAIAFLPAVPWPTTSQSTAKVRIVVCQSCRAAAMVSTDRLNNVFRSCGCFCCIHSGLTRKRTSSRILSSMVRSWLCPLAS